MEIKVLQIIPTLIAGGAEKLLIDSIPFYHKNGIKVDVLLLNGIETPFLNELKKHKYCNVYTISTSTVYSPALIFKIKPFLKKYDLAHVHLFPALYWVVMAKILARSPIKLIYTEHNTSNRRRKLFLLKKVERFFYGYYDKIITIAGEVDFQLKKHLSFPNHRFQMINNGVNIQEFEMSHPYLKSDFFSASCKILIQVSSFREQKDQITLIKAVSKLPSEIKLLLVGDGPLRTKCEKLTQKLDLLNRIKFLGNRMDVPKLLKTADIIVLSSFYEGLSLSSIEGMASGRPFIASNVPGLREIVDGAGILFEKENEIELASIILKLFADKEYYDRVVDDCMSRARNYDINTMVYNYTEVFKNVILAS